MMHKFLLLYSWFIRTLLLLFPDVPFIMKVRGFLYFLPVFRFPHNLQISANVIIKNIENITFGNNVYIAPNCVINAVGKVNISDEVMVGFNSVLVSGNHTILGKSFRFGSRSVGEIYIGHGSWVSANCTVLSGSNIGCLVLIGANSVVNSSCKDNSLYAGTPVVFKKNLKEDI